MWNSDDKSLAASESLGQPRGDCPYQNNLNSVGAVPLCQPYAFAIERISFTE
jgi:hypothetical protein